VKGPGTGAWPRERRADDGLNAGKRGDGGEERRAESLGLIG